VDSRFAARHVQALDIARRSLAAGARTSTVGFLTGLDRWALRRYFIFDPADAPRPGKRPDSPERFVKNATLLTMIEASMVYAIYRDHRDRWPHPAEALLAAYVHYINRRVPHELSFDRVFYVVSWTDRLWAWAAREAVFRFTPCGHCHCRYLAPPTAIDNHARDCPFCKLMLRYQRDRRLNSRFSEPPLPQVAAVLAQMMDAAAAADGQGSPEAA
jgi:flagellar transcriptional activator FlhC